MTAPAFRYKVVVAEDELPILENLTAKLAALDFPFVIVGAATDGEQALELIREHSPHILFTDIKMPVMDGIALIEKARELLPLLKIVIISGYNDFEYAKQAILYNVTDYLIKPVSTGELTETAGKLTESLNAALLSREREIIVGQLSGGGTSAALPSEFGDNAFHLFLVCIGSIHAPIYSSLDLEKSAAAWNASGLTQLLEQNTTAEDRWWLVGEKHPNCRILIVSVRPGDPDGRIFTQLRERVSETVTVCGIRCPIHFGEIWIAAQRLRELLAQRFVPTVSQFILLEDLTAGASSKGLFPSYGSAEELADKIKRYIDERYLTPITIDTISELFHFSPSYITRIFKSQYGTPPFRYLLGLRIKEAQRLIAENDDLNISLISGMVGYDDPHYFSRIFKSFTGLSPTQYKSLS